MTAFQFLKELHSDCKFHSRERDGLASSREIQRWFSNKAVIINGEAVSHDSIIQFPLKSMVLFPKGRKVTLL